MLRPVYQRVFEKEVEKAKKRGKDMEKLKTIIKLLLEGKPLPIKNRNHRSFLKTGQPIHVTI